VRRICRRRYRRRIPQRDLGAGPDGRYGASAPRFDDGWSAMPAGGLTKGDHGLWALSMLRLFD
jgi:hypothetical protein